MKVSIQEFNFIRSEVKLSQNTRKLRQNQFLFKSRKFYRSSRYPFRPANSNVFKRDRTNPFKPFTTKITIIQF